MITLIGVHQGARITTPGSVEEVFEIELRAPNGDVLRVPVPGDYVQVTIDFMVRHVVGGAAPQGGPLPPPRQDMGAHERTHDPDDDVVFGSNWSGVGEED